MMTMRPLDNGALLSQIKDYAEIIIATSTEMDIVATAKNIAANVTLLEQRQSFQKIMDSLD